MIYYFHILCCTNFYITEKLNRNTPVPYICIKGRHIKVPPHFTYKMAMEQADSNYLTGYEWVCIPKNSNQQVQVPVCTKTYYTKKHAEEAMVKMLENNNYDRSLYDVEYPQKKIVQPRNFELNISNHETLIRFIILFTWYKIIKWTVKDKCLGCKWDFYAGHREDKRGCVYLHKNNLAEKTYWETARSMGGEKILFGVVSQCFKILETSTKIDVLGLFQQVYNNLPPDIDLFDECVRNMKQVKDSPEHYLVMQALEEKQLRTYVKQHHVTTQKSNTLKCKWWNIDGEVIFRDREENQAPKWIICLLIFLMLSVYFSFNYLLFYFVSLSNVLLFLSFIFSLSLYKSYN